MLKPWLNFDLYKQLEDKKQKEKSKLEGIAKTSFDNIETQNAYEQFMKNLGLNKETTNG